MRLGITIAAGAVLLVALAFAVASPHPGVRRVGWTVAAVALGGGVLAWFLFDLYRVDPLAPPG